MKLLKLSLILSLLVPAAVSAQTDGYHIVGETPLVVFKMPAQQKDVLPALNLMANSVAYGLSTNMIRNGSGTDSSAPLAQQGYTEQGLRMLSMMDLYFSYGIAQRQVKPMNLGIQIVPYWPSLDSKLQGLQLQGSPDLQALLQPLAPLTKPVIKTYPTGRDWSNPEYAKDVRSAQLAALQRRFPTIATYNSIEPLGKLVWMVQAFSPFYTSIDMNITGNTGTASTTLMTPPLAILSGNLDQLKKDPVNSAQRMQLLPFELSSDLPANDPRHINVIPTTVAKFTRISVNPKHSVFSKVKLSPEQEELRKFRAQGRAIRTVIRKNYSDPDRLNMDVTFGYLPQATKSASDMDAELNSGRALVENMDFALLVSGQMELTKDVIKDEKIRAAMNNILKNLELHLAIHKLALTMTRSPVVRGKAPMLSLNYWKNADWMFQYDPGFPLQNVVMLPEKSVISFKIRVKTEAIEQLKSTSWWTKLTDTERRRQNHFVKTFCALSDDYEKEKASLLNPINVLSLIFTKKILEKPCEVTAISVAQFKSKFIGEFVNKMISAEVGANVKSSTDPQLQRLDQLVDPAIKALSVEIVKQIQRTRGEAQEILQALLAKSYQLAQ